MKYIAIFILLFTSYTSSAGEMKELVRNAPLSRELCDRKIDYYDEQVYNYEIIDPEYRTEVEEYKLQHFKEELRRALYECRPSW